MMMDKKDKGLEISNVDHEILTKERCQDLKIKNIELQPTLHNFQKDSGNHFICIYT